MKLKEIVQPKPNEQILLIVRESIVPHLGIFFLYSVWFLVPFFFLYPLFRLGTKGEVFFSVLVFSGAFLFLRTFRRWARTFFVITDHRLIDVVQRGMIDREVTESHFEDIEDVSYRIQGVIATLFCYGSVFVKRHGKAADLLFTHIRKPERVQDLLNDLRKSVHE